MCRPLSTNFAFVQYSEYPQAKAKKDLDDERKKHADDIQHIEELEAHYAETLEGYKVLMCNLPTELC